MMAKPKKKKAGKVCSDEFLYILHALLMQIKSQK